MSDIKNFVTIPVKSREEAVELIEEYWGEMVWDGKKCYPVDEENPCIIHEGKMNDEMVRYLLDQPFHISTLNVNNQYSRTEDDCDGDKSKTLNIGLSQDGDYWVSMGSGIEEYRFRMPVLGGGRSPRTRNALMILAEAIRLDNEESGTDR